MNSIRAFLSMILATSMKLFVYISFKLMIDLVLDNKSLGSEIIRSLRTLRYIYSKVVDKNTIRQTNILEFENGIKTLSIIMNIFYPVFFFVSLCSLPIVFKESSSVFTTRYCLLCDSRRSNCLVNNPII